MKQNQETGTTTSLLTQARIIVGGIGAVVAMLLLTPASFDTISGVINEYSAVSYLSEDKVVVGDPSAFSAGDRVLLIQMKGAAIIETEDTTYGDVTDYGYAGMYEFTTLSAISGDTLVLDVPVCHDFDVAGAIQVVRVPEYEQVIIDDQLTADSWDGSTGGVVAVWANQAVYLQDTIDATGLGFEGGGFNGSSSSAGVIYACDVSSGKGGVKGEGITTPTQQGCMGKAANGGGGGNDHNCGGGGGSNYGAGGLGGYGWKSGTPGSDTGKGGIGGLEMAYMYATTTDRILLGGGGGGGHQNNGASYPAGNGGGIIFIVTPEMEVSSGGAIIARGGDAQDVTVNDGASGGGGGGSIFLQVDSWTDEANLSMDVSGGHGADIYTANQHGPGGGGGGGVIISVSSLPAGIQTELSGGTAGTFISNNSSHLHHMSHHGSEEGEAGAVISGAVLRECSVSPEIDLNGEEAGTDASIEFIAGTGSTAIVENGDINISDDDDLTMQQASVLLSNPLDQEAEYLSITMDNSTLTILGIAASVSSDGYTVTMSGEASVSDYETVLSSIHYHNDSTAPDLTERVITVSVNDGGSWSNSAESRVEMMAGSFPVEWLGFDVEWSGRVATLEWSTALEQNADYFSVERSFDADVFTSIGEVGANGTTNDVSFYRYDDMTAAEQGRQLYYRLRQVDFNGQFMYSSTIELAPTGQLEDVFLSVYPNPANDIVNIEWKNANNELETELYVRNINGQLISTIHLPAGQSVQQLNVSDWVSGTYLLTINGTTPVTKRLIVR